MVGVMQIVVVDEAEHIKNSLERVTGKAEGPRRRKVRVGPKVQIGPQKALVLGFEPCTMFL